MAVQAKAAYLKIRWIVFGTHFKVDWVSFEKKNPLCPGEGMLPYPKAHQVSHVYLLLLSAPSFQTATINR